MEYKVDGLTFTDEQLDSKLVLPRIGEVSGAFYFFIPKYSTNCFTLVKPGQYISEEIFQKLSGKQIYSLTKIDERFCGILEMALENFKTARDELGRIRAGINLERTIVENFDGSMKIGISFLKTFFKEFYEINPQIASLLDEKSEILFQRSLAVASFSIIHSLRTGIVDYFFLKRTFNILFCMDIGLVLDGDITSNILIACELERKNRGAGQIFIKKKSQKESELFFSHPEKGRAFLSRIITNDQYSSLIETVLSHHQYGDMTGFPKKFSATELTVFEQNILKCDTVIPFIADLLDTKKVFESISSQLVNEGEAA